MRKFDSGWRDVSLGEWHRTNGFEAPSAGMTLPMIEYDSGEPLAVINYIRRDQVLPFGRRTAHAYRAMGRLRDRDGRELPFLTVRYDPRNWAVQTYAHNPSAVALLRSDEWVSLTEAEFASLLYRLRGRKLPDLSPYGVAWSDAWWLPSLDEGMPVTPWPGSDMSARRRAYEPVQGARFRHRIPCVDIDLMVPDTDGRPSLVVDYKQSTARVHLGSTNMRALSGLHVGLGGGALNVPAMVVRYTLDAGVAAAFDVRCLNPTAQNHLSYVLGPMSADTEALADGVSYDQWVKVTESQWLEVLRCARHLV